MKEFNLSDNIINYHIKGKCIYTKDVKEFIKRLKEDTIVLCNEVELVGMAGMALSIHELIDKLAGEKLI